ncbi:MAG: cupin domain-containing protein [Candidatus Krumholzibacteria bacterium]|nr:cupin domain-containing protein [Candidatus Krumholzibacteria bacterium]
MTEQTHDRHLTLPEAMRRLPDPEGARSARMLTRGSLSVEIYAPRGKDPQGPHEQDEVYVVVEGGGWFVNGDIRHRFSAGDVMLVPAGVVHRFEEFTDDLVLWVVFHGPKGGGHA